MSGAILPVGGPVIQGIAIDVHHVFAIAFVRLTGADQSGASRIAVLPLLDLLV